MLRDLILLLPINLLAIGGILILILSLVSKRKAGASFTGYFSSLILIITGFLCYFLWDGEEAVLSYPYFRNMLILNEYTMFFSILIIFAGIISVFISIDYLPQQEIDYGEYYTLLVFSVLGMIVMVSAREIITLFLGLEIMSICLYVLSGFKRKSTFSTEGSLKYFIMGAFSSGFFLLGTAFLYGITGSTNIEVISRYFLTNPPFEDYLFSSIAIFSLIVAFGFKIGLVPFHMWVADVYQGSPTPAVAWMSAGVKVAGFSAMGRFFLMVFQNREFLNFPLDFSWAILVLSIITMTFGNILALLQTNVKRLLAYSSIAHAGYILLGFWAFSGESDKGIGQLNSSVPFYLFTYVLATLITFGIVSLQGAKDREDMGLEVFSGFSSRHPFLAVIFSIGLLSLAGIPPMAGFFGKFYLFKEVLLLNPEKNLPYIIIGVLNSVLAVYYYLKVIVYIYMKPEKEDVATIKSAPAFIAIVFACILTLHGGIFPSIYLNKSISASKKTLTNTIIYYLNTHTAKKTN